MSNGENGQYATINGETVYLPNDPRLRAFRSTDVGNSNAEIAQEIKIQSAAKIQGQQDDFIKRINAKINDLNDEYKRLTGEDLLADNLTDRYAGKSKLNKQLAQWKQLSNEKSVEGLTSIKYQQLQPQNIGDDGGIGKEDKTLYFVQMRVLLNWIESNILLYNKSVTIPNFKIDTGKNNYMLHFPKQISANPTVCIIPVRDGQVDRKNFNDYRDQYDQGRKDKFGNYEFKKVNNKFIKNELFQESQVEEPVKENSSQIFYGRLPAEYQTARDSTAYLNEQFLVTSYLADIMHIRLNLDFISSVVNDNIDLDGNLNFVTFMKEMLNGVKAALGYINNFELIYDKEFNYFRILDNNILKYGNRKEKNYSPSNFVVGGFDSFEIEGDSQSYFFGSFIEDVNFTTTLDNKFASMVTIAAQSDSKVVGMDTTGLSRFNDGLTDRIIPKKQSIDEIENNGNSLSEDDLSELLNNAKAIASQIYGEFRFSNEDLDIFMSLNRDIANYFVNDAVVKKEIPSPLVIPFNLSLQMMGLSGMRINERFDVSTKILPPMFDNKAYNFITKAVSHEIKNNKWITTLESQIINKEDPNSPDIPVSNTEFESFAGGSGGGKCPAPSGWPGPVEFVKTTLTVEDAAAELKRLAPDEKNLQIFTLMVMMSEQGSPIKGFNNNYGGIDITAGKWKYDASIHNGYVCARDGGTGEQHAFASFKEKGGSLKFKLDTFRARGFGATDIETNIDLQSYISVFAGNKNKKRQSKYGSDKGNYYSLTVPKYSAAYFNDWNGWGVVSIIIKQTTAYGKQLASQYSSEKAYVTYLVNSNKVLWNKAKTALGYS